MDITRFAIEKDRITLAVLFVLLFAGISSYLNMSRSEEPGYTVRTALVQTAFPGASPERVELLVTDKLEKVIQQIPELDYVTSSSRTGLSVIYVNIEERYKEMRPIWDDLRRKIDDARPELPEGVVGPFVNDEFGDVFGTVYTLTGDGISYRELKEIAKDLQNELLLTDEVAKVEIGGDQDEWVVIEYNNARLSELGLSPKMLIKILQDRNIILPGGDFRTHFEKIVFEPSGNFESVDEIRRSVVNLPDSNQVVRLEDIVNIERTYIFPPNNVMHYNGTPSVELSISLREGGNIILLGEQVDAVMERALQNYPIGVGIHQYMFQADLVDEKISNFLVNLYQAVAIVALVMLVALGLRTGLIVASLIPMTIIITFFLMSTWGVWLEQVSLASLIIALGILVDNAIVMAESIIVRMKGGDNVKKAAIDSASELRIPLLTSSLTTIAAFLPIIIAESAASESVASLFKVVAIALLTSWMVTLTIIPLLCVHFLKVKTSSKKESFDSAFYTRYRNLLLIMVTNPWKTMALVVFIFFSAIYSFKFIPNIFFADNERPTFTIELELPQGTPIERTIEVASEVEAYMKNYMVSEDNPKGIINWGTYIGNGGPKFVLSYNPEPPNLAYAIMVVNTTDLKTNLNVLIPEIEAFIVEHYPDVDPTLRPMPNGPDAWPPVAVRISGRDIDKIFNIVDEVKAQMATIPGAKLITDDWGGRTKKIVLNVDEARAQLAGVTNEDVAISMQTFLSGVEATDFRERDELIPIMIRSDQSNPTSTDVGSIDVFSQATGQTVPLAQVADPVLLWEPGTVERYNRLRTVTVEALVEQGYTASQIVNQIRPWLEEHESDWGFGYFWEFGGEQETSVESRDAILDKLPISGLIIVMLLIAQFNSIVRPAIIILTIPLAIVGVALGLLITRQPFDFMTMLGLISLAGILINNAIVLLDRIQIEIRDNALPVTQAVIEAAQQRLRPILLTTVTTVCGMIPLWIGGGLMWRSMSIGIIFGILVATTLTLGVVPVLYTLFYKLKYNVAEIKQKYATQG